MNLDYRPVVPSEYGSIRLFLISMGWGKRVADPVKFEKMMHNTDRTVAVWNNDQVIGFGRALCDDVSNGYLSMIAVSPDYRGKGIGRQIVLRLMGESPDITWVLRSGRKSRGFWEKIGFSASQIAMEKTRQSK